MLVGYVSDEDYVAIPDCQVLIEQEGPVCDVRSSANGAIYADVTVGLCRITLAACGHSSKTVDLAVGESPVQFRLPTDRMYGMMWPKWSRSGEISEYCVHSTAAFRLDLWRYGWEKEWIRSYGWCDEHGPRAMTQILPDGDFTQTGVQWNRTGYTLEFQKHGLAAPDRGGLYFLHAQQRNGTGCVFPWIVSPPEPREQIAVLASTLTWNAYNRFGGRSNYFNQAGLPAVPVVNARQDLGRYLQPDEWPFGEHGAPLSFQRPEPDCQVPLGDQITDPIAGRMGSALAPGEWRLLGWLEREGFAYDLYSETELHFDRVDLDRYRVLVLNNHPEYWTASMYHRVKEWVYQRGGKLVYPGGCGLYAEAELPDEATMLCRQEGAYDQRGESEANLLGVAYSHGGFQTGAPYRVLEGDHWVFAGTGLSTGDLFGHESLHERCPGGASAHELDKISPHSPPGVCQLAKGENPERSGAEMACFETPSGGAVFAAGSMCWTLALPIDAGVSAVTRNVLERYLEG